MVFEDKESTLEYLLDLIEQNANDDAEKAFEKGMTYKKFEQYLDASKELSKAIILNKYYFDAYNQRALCYLALEKFDLSIVDCSKAIELTDDNVKQALIYEARSRSYIEKKDFIQALTDLNKSCELTFSEAFDRRGILHFKLGNFYEALLDFNQMFVMHSNNGYYKFKMGLCYYKLNEIENALNELNISKGLGFQKAEAIIQQIKAEQLLKKIEKK